MWLARSHLVYDEPGIHSMWGHGERQADARQEDAEMREQSDAVVRHRRRYLLIGALLSGLFTLEGLVVAFFDHALVGYLFAIIFGLGTVYWAASLLIPADFLSELPASHFRWLAPNELGTQTHQPEIPPARKISPPGSKPVASQAGVWDRELDA